MYFPVAADQRQVLRMHSSRRWNSTPCWQQGKRILSPEVKSTEFKVHLSQWQPSVNHMSHINQTVRQQTFSWASGCTQQWCVCVCVRARTYLTLRPIPPLQPVIGAYVSPPLSVCPASNIWRQGAGWLTRRCDACNVAQRAKVTNTCQSGDSPQRHKRLTYTQQQNTFLLLHLISLMTKWALSFRFFICFT